MQSNREQVIRSRESIINAGSCGHVGNNRKLMQAYR